MHPYVRNLCAEWKALTLSIMQTENNPKPDVQQAIMGHNRGVLQLRTSAMVHMLYGRGMF